MRKWTTYFIFTTFLVSGPAYSNMMPCRLRLSIAQPIVELGQDNKITLRLSNTGTFPLSLLSRCRSSGAECDYTVTMTRSDGLIPQKTTSYKTMTNENLRSDERPLLVMYGAFPTTLISGQSYAATTTLNTMFYVKEAGSYVIRASRNLPDHDGKRVIYSNSVTVLVEQR